jgi:hypothetical protein
MAVDTMYQYIKKFSFWERMSSTNVEKTHRENVQIFLTIGECLPAFLVLYQTGPVRAKKPSPKIWYIKFKIC